MKSLSKNQKINMDIDTMVSIIKPHNSCNNLILKKTKSLIFHEIVNLIKQKNFHIGDSSMNQGLVVLFTGRGATGKTHVIKCLADYLDLTIFRIDLSQVVNKYMGETEKNLKRIFDAAEDGGAILLFDEADALFDKRSNIKDGNDDYSNVVVSYLLQRVETYRGLVILTTNMKSNKISNLQREHIPNLQFIADFPCDLEE